VTVQLDRNRELGTGIVEPSQPDIELPKAAMALSRERARAEIFSQGEGLLIVGLGLIALRKLTLRCDVAEEEQSIRLVARFPVLTGMCQCVFGTGVRLLQAAGEQMRFSQGDTRERLGIDFSHCNGLLLRLREQGHGIGATPSESGHGT
jgi:hypothetical protein